MIGLLPWLGMIVGLATLGWIVAGMVLRLGLGVRAASAMLLPAFIVGIGVYLANIDPGFAIPDQSEASFHVVLTTIFAFGSTAVTVVTAIPVWFLLESRLGHRAQRD